jgi:hypothetical protein
MALFTSIRAQEIFYVAPNGNDGNAGTIGQPLKTLSGAKTKVRTVLDGSGDITVYFRGGTYVFNSTVVFGLQDSGGANQKITYAAYPGETPVFTSLVRITGWTDYSGNIKQAPLPAGIDHVRYLQDASENWMARSATSVFTPAETSSANEGPMYEASGQPGKKYTVYPGGWSAPNWAYAPQYDLRITMAAWVVNVLPISSVNSGSRRINVATPATYQMKNCQGDCVPAEGWVLNSIEGIDSPGEWACLNGSIYLYPKSGAGDIYVPQLVEFVRIDASGNGNTWNGTPVQYITFDGITFTGGDFYIRRYDYNNPLNSDVTSQHDWGLVDRPAGMFEIRNAANCQVINCTFEKSGGGLRLDRYAQNIKVYNNTFRYLGREAISLMGRGPGYGDVNKNNEIGYNAIVATGREKWDAPAINLDQSSHNNIHHNFIDDTHVSAIIFTSSRGPYVAAKAYEDSDDYFIGAECHYWEVAPAAVQYMIDNIDDGEDPFIRVHRYFYNYNNVIEKNVVTNAHNGHKFYINYGTPTNGVIYTSGDKHNETNTFRLNYIYNLSPGDTQFLYQDSYADNIDILKNMLHNAQMNAEEGVIFDVYINTEFPATGRGLVRSNVIQNSSYWSLVLGTALQQAGNMDLSSGNPGGGAAYVNDYIEMYRLLCPGNLPGPNPLPGAAEMRSKLAAKITAFGGAVPVCSQAAGAVISLNRDHFYFGATPDGVSTSTQLLLIENTGTGALNWSVSLDRAWLSCTPTTGTGPGVVTVSVDPTGLTPGAYTGTLTVSASNAANSPQTAAVTLNLYASNQTSVPFGHFATPIHGSAASGSIPVTGWVLDDIGIESVKIYRGNTGALAYIGDAVFVEGARPDVVVAHPGYPMNYKAGWGYMMLTHFLPGGGNGSFQIHAVARDKEGHQVTLGTKTIHVDNKNAVKPFGAIDTPTQGGSASGGRFINWGWVLTPQPNSIPTDGSTINVYVDGVNLGNPTYDIYRPDIAGLFPGYANSNGAIGYFYLDTEAYENGVHTIQWTATDSDGNNDGIGSRYFTVQNTGSPRTASKKTAALPHDPSGPLTLTGGEKRGHTLEIQELERVEVCLSSTIITGYLLVGGKRYPLPVGSTFRDGVFYWSPGPGFLGEYRLMFVVKNQAGDLRKRELTINIRPRR